MDFPIAESMDKDACEAKVVSVLHRSTKGFARCMRTPWWVSGPDWGITYGSFEEPVDTISTSMWRSSRGRTTSSRCAMAFSDS